ncbi:hypothetical protein MLD38_027598 [Melastoma candidum]|uniref:Uncharacterized protein n=1 Tax=Melastoma candidum TaxID=119954 RepID=A0ACB9P385_9MYRT|nr:hypothetical protein MLD38_027598 [Melastoma candidum]
MDRIRKMPVREPGSPFGRGQRRKDGWRSGSPPVDIPGNNRGLQGFEEEYGDGGMREELVPPHVIVDRKRIDGKAVGRPVCFGRGGTLKGRYLSQVRNSVLRLTGFLES